MQGMVLGYAELGDPGAAGGAGRGLGREAAAGEGKGRGSPGELGASLRVHLWALERHAGVHPVTKWVKGATPVKQSGHS